MPRNPSVRTVPGYGDKLRQRLKAAGMTQLELANATGLSRQTLSRALNEDQISARSAQRIDDVLKRAPDEGGRPSAAGSSSRAWTSATDLADWSNRRDAQEELPQIIRRLILVTADGVRRLSFRAGEGVQLSGWDGRVAAGTATAFVPAGESVWEIGTSSDPGGKAQRDYDARLADPGDVDPSTTTFVFVTSRRWPNKDAWAAARRADRRWKEVRVIDADDLETWLESAPSVHLWLSERLGSFPEGAHDLSSWWAGWTSATRPSLNAAFLLAGAERAKAASQLANWRAAANEPVALRSESRDESAAVIAASLTMLPDDEAADAVARAVVVSNAAAWRRLVAARTQLILIPVFDNADVAAANRAGHAVFLALGESDVEVDGELSLPPIPRELGVAALIAAGEAEDRARELAGIARRSMMSLRRQVGRATALQRPAWAKADVGRTILPALFAGAWNENSAGDKAVLEQLGRRPYEEIAEAIDRFAHDADPVVRRRGPVWYLVSREDAWELLARYMKHEDVERFVATALDVLATPDPRLELPVEQRWMAAVYDKRPAHSNLLRSGLAATVAVLGCRVEQATTQHPTNQSLSHAARRIARSVFEKANTDARIWASVADVLPDLAEAAPDEFLTAVENGLRSADRPIATMFSDQGDPMFTSSPHTGLLWALERLAWSQQYLGRVVGVLAQLDDQDPGGRLMNRPAATLTAIFRPWFPQTSASVAARFAVIDSLSVKDSDCAWMILISMMPQLHAHGTYADHPRWRDWGFDRSRRVSGADYEASIGGAVERLVRLAGIDGERWAQLIEALSTLGETAHALVLSALDKLVPADMAVDDRTRVWTALRTLVARHREVPDAQWAMNEERVAAIDSFRERFAPDDYVARFAWLFQWHPEIPKRTTDANSFEARDAEANAARVAAVREIYSAAGLSGLLKIAAAAKDPHFVGGAAGDAGVCDEDEVLIRYLAAEDMPAMVFAHSFALGRQRAEGSGWVEATVDRLGTQLMTKQRAALLATLPPERSTWAFATRLGEEIERAYWSMIGFVGKDSDIEFAVRRQLHFGEVAAAVDLIGMSVHHVVLPPEIILNALERLLAGEMGTRRPTTSLHWHLRELLNQLAADGTIDQARIARLEWGFLPVLDGHIHNPDVLHRALASQPELFVDLVSILYRAEGEDKRPKEDITEDDRQRASRAWSLLRTWRTVPGSNGNLVDASLLKSWITEARRGLQEVGRIAVGDQKIGEMLSGSPNDVDGTWPCAVVRAVIEESESNDLVQGLSVGVYNSRGVISRSLREGGALERSLAEKYDGFATAVADTAPRSAAMLRSIAESYRADAAREDHDAALEEDLDL